MFAVSACQKKPVIDLVVTENIKISTIPKSAEIIFHDNSFIYAMDKNGENITQITFDNSRTLEHVAVSYDRTKIVANYFSDLSQGGQSSKVLLFDIEKQTVVHLVPEFQMSGNGGVDWDKNGFVYFSGVAKLPYANPSKIPEYKANAGANDIYRVKYDGTGLQNLTNSTDYGEADVSVSADSRSIAYMATNIINPENSFTEIWKRDADGNNPQLIYIGGKDRVSSVHDPEISPDGKSMVFSRVNNSVAPVFPNNPWANTAHDILRSNISDSKDFFVVTESGPISIAPDWKGDKILYLEITDKTDPPHAGLAVINPDGTGYKLIKNGANIGKWIP